MQIRNAYFLASARDMAHIPPPLFAEVAFAGRSNVGKSSLINALLQRRKLVRTSSTPGCTRALQLFRIELMQGMLDFVDLPGYGYAKRSKAERQHWAQLIEAFLTTRAGLRAVVVIIDIRRGLGEADQQLLDYVQHTPCKPVVVATKLDKLPRSQRQRHVAQVQRNLDWPVHRFSASTGEGREALWKALLEVCAIRPDGTTGER